MKNRLTFALACAGFVTGIGLASIHAESRETWSRIYALDDGGSRANKAGARPSSLVWENCQHRPLSIKSRLATTPGGAVGTMGNRVWGAGERILWMSDRTIESMPVEKFDAEYICVP